LAAALCVARQHPEIDIYEIDFVTAPDGRIVSSHDYAAEAIADGSDVLLWIEAIVVERGKVLWLDVKENLDLYFAWQYGTFDHALLFAQLAEARKKWPSAALPQRLWLGCQDVALRKIIRRRCDEDGWQFIMDMPAVSGYVWQRLASWCCAPRVNQLVGRQMLHSDYQSAAIISIDRTFFASPKELKRFVRALQLKPGVIVVLNSFPLSREPILVEDGRIVMQYDYTCL
jgi:hypothetical protein